MDKNSIRQNHGFSLIELVVVMAGLGILSSLTIPAFIKYLDYSHVDEVKALLNSAAADCLQKFRSNTDSLDETVNPDIISNDRLESAGYRFEKKDTNKCADTMITSVNESSKARMPNLGFKISTKGVLTKWAVDTGKDSLSAAKSWAGQNVVPAAGLDELREYEKENRAAKKACDKSFANWEATKPTGFKPKWNPIATSGCPTRPPKVVSKTCTTNGCNDPTYYLDGKYCGKTSGDLSKCIEKKLGKLCADKISYHRNNNTTSSISKATIISECGNKEFWFCKGIDQGTKTDLENCLRKDQEASCIAQQEEAREQGKTGKFGPLPGPGECGNVKYICDGTFVNEQDYFINCATPKKQAPPKCSSVLGSRDTECWDYEMTPTLVNTCGPRPLKNNGASKDCGAVGEGRPNHKKGWNKFAECGQWAKCMGF